MNIDQKINQVRLERIQMKFNINSMYGHLGSNNTYVEEYYNLKKKLKNLLKNKNRIEKLKNITDDK